MRSALLALALAVTASVVAQDADSKLEKAAAARTFFGISDELLRADLSKVKVAILSDGLTDGPIDKNRLVDAKYLPDSAQWFPSYEGVETDPPRRSATARRVAQIVWALTGFSKDGPEFRLYNANGLRSFREAVKSLVEWKADVVVCTVNFEGMGNFDGRGFVNKLVETATDEGIVWVQSGGEYHGRVVVPKLKGGDGKETFQRIAKIRSRADKNPVRLVLTWNAFAPGKVSRPTEKDLDLYLYDPERRDEPLKSELRQAPTDANPDGNLPVETITTELFAHDQTYDVYVMIRGGVFSLERDRVRLTVLSEKKAYYDADNKKEVNPVEVLDASNRGEIMVPADNREVVTVADQGLLSAVGPTEDGRDKPDVVLDEYPAFFSDKAALSGPHAAAAYLGAAVVAMRANAPGLRASHVLRIARDLPSGDGKDTSRRWKTPSAVQLKTIVE